MEYVTLKWLHVLSSTIVFGTGIGSAYYLLAASRQPDVRSARLVLRHVVIADWVFTTPAMIFQPLSGFLLAHQAGIPLGSRWIVWSTVLYVLAAACWLPVIALQIRMRNLAGAALAADKPLPSAYQRCFRVWFILGWPALLAFTAIFYLMVAKPS